MRHLLHMSLGSFVIFVACSATSGGQRSVSSSGGAAGIAAAGASGAESGGTTAEAGDDATVLDAALDVLGDPVAEADASEAGAPTEVVADCKTEVLVPGGVTLWAEASFPGRTVAELARVVVFRNLMSSDPEPPPGYTHALLSAWTVARDGAVAVNCGVKGPQAPAQVTFRLP